MTGPGDPLRALRRPVRPGDADAGARRPGAHVGRGVERPGVPGRAGAPAARLRRAAVAAVPGDAAERGGGARDLPQARGPQPHRRAQDQQRARVRRCWPSGWASRASSPRPARARTAPRPRPRARCWTWSASSTWARSTSRARSPTSSGCSCSARRSCRCRPGSRTLKEATSEAIRDWVANVDTHALRARHGRRAGAVSGAGARAAADHRRRGARAAAGARGAPARPRAGVRRRRLQRDGDLRGVHPGRGRRARRRRGRRRGAGRAPRRAADLGRARRRPARLASRDHAGRRGPDPRGPLDLRRASTTPASAPSTPGCATPAARPTSR